VSAAHFDVIVIGGGAAGLFCALTAGQLGRRVLVLEHNERLGNKILISGGGRCNFTNIGATAANYVTSGSPHFTKSAFARYTPRDFLDLVERHGIAWHEKKLGQLFCDQSSRQIVSLLEAECSDGGVEVRLRCRVQRVGRAAANPDRGWHLDTTAGGFTADSLVIATGGLSFPKLGATPFGYEIARQFGVKLVEPRPGLVPLTLSPADLESFSALSGVSLDVQLRVEGGRPAFRENMLFTHRGLSGPSVLQISSQRRPGEAVFVNLLPEHDAAEFLRAKKAGGADARAALRAVWPDRFLRVWCERHAPTGALAQLPAAELEAFAARLGGWRIEPAGDEGYPKAEVTLGGVDTGELSSKTMECRQVPGLFFIGEVVDVTGWLGGYNFQWAWASGHAAGEAV
jgi:predicted Rossmann fold flavoprotein